MKTVSIGAQYFDKLREDGSFYIDKTDFIKEWWESRDEVTLITRPRRFGKTLNMHMLDCFFSTRYAGRSDLFEGLSIWKEPEGGGIDYRKLQGTFPCIFLSFAAVKAGNMKDARDGIIEAVAAAYESHSYLKNSSRLDRSEKRALSVLQKYTTDTSKKRHLDNSIVCSSLNRLCMYLQKEYGKKALIFLDEYDTPLQEAWLGGYWEELVSFLRTLFDATFKTNPYLDRAVMTGITRVSKESIFSDMNNLRVVTTTSGQYESSFGFTEEEVFSALDEQRSGARKDAVKAWYDGFCFGDRKDIYNPWSITNFLKEGLLRSYWTDSSSNGLVSELIREGTEDLKMQMEDLLDGKALDVLLDEQIVFPQLRSTPNAIWSLLMAAGYVKPVEARFMEGEGKTRCRLMVTNRETLFMFRNLISAWFPADVDSFPKFKKALLMGDVRYMNRFMNEVSRAVFSSFDTGIRPSGEAHPERFYHGFVLGLIVDLRSRYHVRSNRESGFGRYDVAMEPLDPQADDAILIEFKVQDEDLEKDLEETAKEALRQIKEKDYARDLISRGIPQSRIRSYGFAFRRKEVLILQG